MSKTWKVVCLLVGVALVLALGVTLVPSMLGSLDWVMAVAPPSPTPPPPPEQPPPVAGLSGQPTMGAEPTTVKFSDRSRVVTLPTLPDEPPSPPPPPIVSWRWDFGDGQTSWQPNPRHTYSTEGVYQVSLTVTDSEGRTNTSSMTRSIIVDAGAAPVGLSVRDLRIEPTYVYPGQPVAIYARILNGGGGWGSQTVHLVINGYVEQSMGVGVSPLTAHPVNFTVYKVTPGTYCVTIGDAIGWFYVMQS